MKVCGNIFPPCATSCLLGQKGRSSKAKTVIPFLGRLVNSHFFVWKLDRGSIWQEEGWMGADGCSILGWVVTVSKMETHLECCCRSLIPLEQGMDTLVVETQDLISGYQSSDK